MLRDMDTTRHVLHRAVTLSARRLDGRAARPGPWCKDTDLLTMTDRVNSP